MSELNKDQIEIETQEPETSELPLEEAETLETTEQPTQELPQEEILKAKKHGHLSKDEYVAKYGTEQGYKTEEEFNKFGDIYPEIKNKLDKLYQKLDQRDKENETLIKYISNVKEREYTRAKQELAQQLAQAKSIGDIDNVEFLTKEQAKLAYQEAQDYAAKELEQQQKAAQDFLQRNLDWFGKDAALTTRAMEIEQEIKQGKYTYLFPAPQTTDQLFRQVEVLMKQENQTKFMTTQKPQLPVSPTLSNTQSKVAKTIAPTTDTDKTFNTLSKDYKDMFNNVSRIAAKGGKTYTKEEFINKLKNDGEI